MNNNILIIILIISNIIVNVISNEKVFNVTINSTIVNKNKFFEAVDSSDWGKLENVLDNENEMLIFEEYLNTTERHGYSDGEAIDSVNNFFWGKKNGIVLEIGGLDGQYLSQSKPLVEKLGWKRLLIEGDITDDTYY